MDTASYDRSWPVAGDPLPSSSISFGMTLVMAIACGVAAANIYYSQPMLGIIEAAFPGQVAVIGLVPTATQLGFAAGLLLLVPLGDRFERRRLILIQLAALTLSLSNKVSGHHGHLANKLVLGGNFSCFAVSLRGFRFAAVTQKIGANVVFLAPAAAVP
jgi:MFS family permease